MSLHPRNNNTNRFHLFEQIFPKFTVLDKLLDFGGNRGNLLYFSNGKIAQHNYTSVDVSLESIEQGKEEFPDASFVYYDRWNSMYNHIGKDNWNFPDIPYKQDYIFSFSVFTHTDYNEFENTIKWLNNFDYKVMAHSLLDIRCKDTVKWFYEKRIRDYGSCVDILSYVDNPEVKILYLYDNHSIDINKEHSDNIDTSHFLVLYDLKWLEEKLKPLGLKRIEKPKPDLHPFIVFEKNIK